MRSLIVLLIIASGCRIADENFTPIGGSDGDGGVNGDGGGADDGSGDDAGPPPTPKTHAYMIDYQQGLFVLAKDATTGGLSYTGSRYTLAYARGIAVHPEESHLYVTDANPSSPRIVDLYLAADGSISYAQSIPLLNCQPRYVAVHPAGKFLLVGCASPYVVQIQILAGGALYATSASEIPIGGAQRLHAIAFTPNGHCAFAGEDYGAIDIRVFQVSANDETVTPVGSFDGPGEEDMIAVHPNGRYLYMAGPTTFNTYAIAPDCSLSQVDSISFATPNPYFAIAVRASGDRLWLAGSQIKAYALAADGKPTLESASFTQFFTGLALDPAVPNVVYVAGATGTFPAGADPMSGFLTMGTPVVIGSSNDMLVLAR